MSEKIPQSNPENIDARKYLIPMLGDTYVYGVINEDRLELRMSKQRNGPDVQIRMVEVIYETVGEDGEPAIERKMISDHILSDDVQQQYLDSINKKKGI